MKYKVGDKVTLKKEVKQVLFGGMKSLLGKTVTISRVTSAYYEFTEDREKWCWDESSVDCLAYNNKIVITTDGTETLARLYEDGKVVKSATAKCSPRDEFDFNIGARLAFDRLFEITAEKKEEPQYYNGKVVCVKSAFPCFWTVGKVYEIKDGTIRADDGGHRVGITKEKICHIGSDNNEFIEIVE